jgi:hypothetical protein
MLGHNAGIGQHGHEVCVPVPPWNDVQMDVPLDACAGGSAEVQAGICPVRFEGAI